MTRRSCIALLLALLVAVTTADLHGDHSSENTVSADHDDHHSSEEDHDHDVHELPFEVKMYEGTYQPATDEDEARVALTVHYEAREPFDVRWTVQNNDIGLSLTDLSGDRTWQHCSQDEHDHYVCTATMQTSIVRALSIVKAEIIHSSDNVVIRHCGFNRAAKNFHGVTTPAHKVYLSAPLVVHEHPARKNYFTSGSDFTFRWELESDNPHELFLVKRKVGAEFAEEELYKDTGDHDEHEEETTVTVGNVATHITMTKTTEIMYDFVVEVTVSGATSDDTGVYVVAMREGLENWVELMEEGAESAYPDDPVMHLQKKVMGPYIGVVCTAEGHGITDIRLYFNGEQLHASTVQQLSVASRTEDARGIAYKANPDDTHSYADFSGDYECQCTTADGDAHAIQEEYTFVAPSHRRRRHSRK